MISVKVAEDPITGDRIVEARVTRKDLLSINLDLFDRAAVNSPEKSAADIFQTLEILARRQAAQVEDERAAS